MKLRITNYELRIRRNEPTLWRIAAFAVIFLVPEFAKGQVAYWYPQSSAYQVRTLWEEDPALFLDPNRFDMVKELTNRSMWLQMGYGRPIFRFGKSYLGLEGSTWARLRILPDFRFPVETADFFFGSFFTWPEHSNGALWRLRLSHISSHDVDGKDTVVGGSSSHYSREFAELDREWLLAPDVSVSGGMRVLFHQVTVVDPWISVPAVITWRFAEVPWETWKSVQAGADLSPMIWNRSSFYLFASSGDGPVWPNITGGVRAERLSYDEERIGEDIFDLQLYYQYGASWAGTDGGAKRSTINLQMDVRGF